MQLTAEPQVHRRVQGTYKTWMLGKEPQRLVWRQITLTDGKTNQIDRLVVRDNWVLESTGTNFPVALSFRCECD